MARRQVEHFGKKCWAGRDTEALTPKLSFLPINRAPSHHLWRNSSIEPECFISFHARRPNVCQWHVSNRWVDFNQPFAGLEELENESLDHYYKKRIKLLSHHR